MSSADLPVYRGHCQRCGRSHGLPRSPQAEAAARELMVELGRRPLSPDGKMYGVLLALGPTGETVTLRAFSGRLDGTAELPGWAAPIPGVQGRADEARTFAKIERLQARLLALAVEPACVEVRRIEADYEQRLKTINANAHRARAAGAAPDPGAARRALRAERTAALSPLSERHEALMAEVAQLKRERRRTSHELHARIREAYQLPSPAGVTTNVEAAFNAPSPGGAGECCAPKLLVEANRRGLRPTGLAEFWWGADSPDGSKVAGALYGPCEERCQPILGHLLCDGGLPVIYEDTHLLVVDKPAGLASVTGPDRALVHISAPSSSPSPSVSAALGSDPSAAGCFPDGRTG